jgi:16S rRNA (guanine527-N7)-methyltransferase
MNEILKYFPRLTEEKKKQFEMLDGLYREWNEKINVISRKDVDSLYTHHILHSLAIAKYVNFSANTEILDIGTGGGFPGIPLAILYPECNFLLVDSTGKKITVVNEIVKALKLENVEAEKNRAEELDVKVDFIVSRAVAPIREMLGWTRKLIMPGGYNTLKNGWLLLKGGDLTEEIKESGVRAQEFSLSDHFEEEFFVTKKLVYIAR